MTPLSGNVRIKVEVNRADFKGYDQLKDIVHYFENSFLPKPTLLKVTGLKDKKIENYVNGATINALNKKKHAVQFHHDPLIASAIIIQLDDETLINAYIPAADVKLLSINSLKEFLKELIIRTNPSFGIVSYETCAEELHEKYYKDSPRTFNSSGLQWLQFFGSDEEKRQGGTAIEQNPYIKTERIANGLLVEVGESPFDACTQAGKDLLVMATKAMPPATWG
jgi:hypothetical protein